VAKHSPGADPAGAWSVASSIVSGRTCTWQKQWPASGAFRAEQDARLVGRLSRRRAKGGHRMDDREQLLYSRPVMDPRADK
jgi:hypothetical protein